MPIRGHCILSHGFESGPDATKVTALDEAAQRLGWTCERPDYTDLDAIARGHGARRCAARMQRLLSLAQAAAARGPRCWPGSSLGAWISGSCRCRCRGRLFLMLRPCAWRRAHAGRPRSCDIDHPRLGRRVDSGAAVVDWARPRHARLLLVDDSHRLSAIATSAKAFARSCKPCNLSPHSRTSAPGAGCNTPRDQIPPGKLTWN